MPSDVTCDEFNQLATRTDIVEREVEGEKLVTRHILEQTRRSGDDLAEVKARLGNVETMLHEADLKGLAQKVDSLDHTVGNLDRKFDGLSREFRKWRQELPSLVGDIMREAIKPLMRKQ